MSDCSLAITVSLGIAEWQVGQAGPAEVQEIIRQADLALYEAKHAGRNRVVAQLRCTKPAAG